jgi:hypothetical protein
MSEFDQIETVLIAKPGETVVVKAARTALPVDLDVLSRAIQSRVAEGVRVLVLGGEIDAVGVIGNAEAGRIAEAVRKATENPGKAFEVGQ